MAVNYFAYDSEVPSIALTTKYSRPETVATHFQDAAGSMSLLF
jgi:hypothetical protein